MPSLCFGVACTHSVIQMASKRQSSASQEAGIMDDVIVTQLPFSHPDGTLCFQQGIWAVMEEGKGLSWEPPEN